MVFEKIAALLAEKLECEVSTITMETKFADLVAMIESKQN